jgi:23S rRNA (guanosine2251-2'-O)-methyltransferase
VTRTRSTGLGGERVPGPRAVRELLVARRRSVRTVWMTRGRDSDRRRLDELRSLARDAGVPVRDVDDERVRAEARTDSPQGVVALAAPVEPAALRDLLTLPTAFLVALDGVTDPRNLGAVLRSAETAGVTGVVLPRHRGALLTPAAMKAAAGAVEHLPVALASGVPAALEDAARGQVWTVGLDPDGAEPIDALSVADRPVMLVFGAEGSGLSRLARERCDVLARIPTHGRLESLNVSAAAAIACHEVARRRPGSLAGAPG